MAKYDIFISYKRTGTRSSEAYGYTLQQLLLQAGYSVFFDQSEMHLGNWEEQLRDNIAGATDVLVLLEQNSLASCYTAESDEPDADVLDNSAADEQEAPVAGGSAADVESDDAEQTEGGAGRPTGQRYKTDWFCREIMAAIEQQKNIVPILIDGYTMPGETELPPEMRYLTKCQALQPHGIPSLGDLVESKLINQEDALRSKPSRGTIRRKKSVSAAQFLVYGDGCNFDMYEYGDLVASLNSSHTAFHPFAYGVDFGGEHRFSFVNTDTGESQELVMNIDPDRQLYIGLIWSEHQCLWTLKERQIAEEQDADRLVRWGKWLYEGNSLYEPDIERSYRCLSRAADLGSEDARTFFAEHGHGIISDKKAPRPVAIKWYERSADYGCAQAMVFLGHMYRRAKGVKQDNGKALEYYRKAARLRNTDGMRWIGNMYRRAIGVGQDYAVALEWYRMAASEGDAIAMYYIGMLYRKGCGVEQDYALALEWYGKSAELGNNDSMRWIGNMYRKAEGVEQDYDVALGWYRKAADEGDAIAMYYIGMFYRKGYAVQKDYTMALEWYRRSAELGNNDSMRWIGDMYRDGHGVEKNYALALEWYKKAADTGDAVAMRFVGIRYRMGQGVEKNYATALEWFTKSAEKGDAVTMRLIGDMYRIGEGMEPDYATALEWYRKSAELGAELSLNSIAWTYHLMGQYDEALPWAEKAAVAKPESASVIDTLATVYQGLHRYDDALKQFERCLALYMEKKNEKGIADTQAKIDALRLLMKK